MCIENNNGPNEELCWTPNFLGKNSDVQLFAVA